MNFISASQLEAVAQLEFADMYAKQFYMMLIRCVSFWMITAILTFDFHCGVLVVSVFTGSVLHKMVQSIAMTTHQTLNGTT